MDACCAVEVLREWTGRGLRLRTRALTTTLFARLCLADLFVHGIGGAKYDEMTDRIIARFFEMPAPRFVTMSATVHLPIATLFDVTRNDITRLKQQARDLEFNSDRHLATGATGKVAELVREKDRLIDEQHRPRVSQLSRRERRERAGQNRLRYQRLREIGTILSRETTELQQRVQNKIVETQQRLDADTILANREFSFCL